MEYTKALEHFLTTMEQIPEIDSPLIGDAMEALCKCLRITGVDVHYYENQEKLAQGLGNYAVFYQKGLYGEVLFHQEINGGGGIAQYHVYGDLYGKPWTEEEKERILLLIKMLYTFNGRNRTRLMVERLMNYDPDTEVLSMAGMNRLLNQYVGRGVIHEYGLAFFNLIRFSKVNQMMPREEATIVMKRYVHGLKIFSGEGGEIARLGGDNFLILFRKENLTEVKEYLAGRVMRFGMNGWNTITIAARAGCYLIEEKEKYPPNMIDRAMCAMQASKRSYANNFVIFEEKHWGEKENFERVEALFPNALEDREFVPYYQPKVNLADNGLVGAEALCRWIRDGEVITPGYFVPALEETGAICELDFYMLDHVCRDIRRWLDMGLPVVRTSVNLSRCNLSYDNVLERIIGTIDRYRVPHQYLEIELTETTTDVDLQDLKRLVEGLAREGISTAIDDFGCGYSSLTLLWELPWKVLKIDKSFLGKDANRIDERRKGILRHVIAMAQEQGLQCVMEGVETTAHIDFLKENNCMIAQGFYFDRPLPKEEFTTRLKKLM